VKFVNVLSELSKPFEMLTQPCCKLRLGMLL